MRVTLGELAVRFGCELRGDPGIEVDSVAALDSAGPRAVTFLANPKYAAQLAATRAGAVILDAKSAGNSPVPSLVVANPHATYARVATSLRHEAKSLPPAVPVLCNGSVLSGNTSFQFFSSGLFGSTRTTRPFGALRSVRIKNLSPMLSITP